MYTRKGKAGFCPPSLLLHVFILKELSAARERVKRKKMDVFFFFFAWNKCRMNTCYGLVSTPRKKNIRSAHKQWSYPRI